MKLESDTHLALVQEKIEKICLVKLPFFYKPTYLLIFVCMYVCLF